MLRSAVLGSVDANGNGGRYLRKNERFLNLAEQDDLISCE
jgi:hypothetical protein